MFSTALHAEYLHDHADYGFEVSNYKFDWKKIKDSRDAYIKRLNGIYHGNLERDKIDEFVSVHYDIQCVGRLGRVLGTK